MGRVRSRRSVAGFFIFISLLFAQVMQAGADPVPCSRYLSGDPAPASEDGTRYGLAWNWFSSEMEPLLSAMCESDQTTITVGSDTAPSTGPGRTLSWGKVYTYDGSSWNVDKPVPVTCDGEQISVADATPQDTLPDFWCNGTLTGSLPANIAWFAGFTCIHDGSRWTCGCTDVDCTQSFWQLQGASQSHLLQEMLAALREVILDKIDFDLDITARSFGDAKDIQRPLFWVDWAQALFAIITSTIDAVFDLISLFDTNPAEFNQKMIQGISEANGFIETISWVFAIQGLQQAGSNLQLSIDGPTYTWLIEDMLTKAEGDACGFGGCVISFDKSAYEKVIRDILTASNESPLIIPHRSSDIWRTKFEIRRGIDTVKRGISDKIQRVIDVLSGLQTLPANFPLENILNNLQSITTKIRESKSRGVDVTYTTSLRNNDGRQTNYSQSVRIGGVGSWEQVRLMALRLFDQNARIDQLITLNTLNDSIIKATAMHVGITYQVFGEIESVVEVSSLLTSGIDIILSNLKSDSIHARDLINQVPQNMAMEFPEELSNVWMITDDITNTILNHLGH